MSGAVEPSVVMKPFGKTKDGQLVHQYTLTGAGGVVMDVIDYGGKVVRLFTPDRSGKLTDITLGFNDVGGYETQDPYFGSLIGRYGNQNPIDSLDYMAVASQSSRHWRFLGVWGGVAERARSAGGAVR